MTIIDPDHNRLMNRFGTILDLLERMSENDMGHVPHALAGQFHDAVDRLQEVYDRIRKEVHNGQN